MFALLSSTVVCVERIRVASLESSVQHNSLLLYYEWKALVLPALERLMSLPDAGAPVEGLASNLVSGEDAPRTHSSAV